jgi:hypothetical protein
MFRIHAPILIVPTAEAREVLGSRLQEADLAAYREIIGRPRDWRSRIFSSFSAA